MAQSFYIFLRNKVIERLHIAFCYCLRHHFSSSGLGLCQSLASLRIWISGL